MVEGICRAPSPSVRRIRGLLAVGRSPLDHVSRNLQNEKPERESAMSNKTKRQYFFELGSKAFMRVSGRKHVYDCPICLNEYADSNELTLEHAPQESIDGKGIALTCKGCNSPHDSGADSAVLRERLFLRFRTGKLDRTIRGKMQVFGESVNIEVMQKSGCTELIIDDKINNPLIAQHTTEALKSDQVSEVQFSPIFHCSPRKASIGYLKSAYIGAFAKFGYSYIRRPCLEIVREQIHNPEKMILQNIRQLTNVHNLPERAILLAKSPVQCIVAKIDDSLICLPWPTGDGVEFWKWHQSMTEKSAVIGRFGGHICPWPTEPEMLIDIGKWPVIKVCV